MRKLKRISLVLFMLVVVFAGYVEIVNMNSKGMTYRQKVLKAVYPAFMWFTRLVGANTQKKDNPSHKAPLTSLYDLSVETNEGSVVSLSAYRGKKLLLVNTASDCGYTGQYAELQKLHEKYGDKLMVLGFPANDFKQQEKGTDAEIASFCQRNFGVSFPLVKKSVVVKGPGQHPVYQWLTDAARNGWCNTAPSWNFSKYLVDENGVLIGYFDPSVSPSSAAITEKLK